MSKFVISTLTDSVQYTKFNYGRTENEMPQIVASVLVHGGAGLSSISQGFGDMSKDGQGVPMWTPRGVVTPVSDAAVELLMADVTFQLHLKNGYVQILDKDPGENHTIVKKIASGMSEGDNASPLTPEKMSTKAKVSPNSSLVEDNRI